MRPHPLWMLAGFGLPLAVLAAAFAFVWSAMEADPPALWLRGAAVLDILVMTLALRIGRPRLAGLALLAAAGALIAPAFAGGLFPGTPDHLLFVLWAVLMPVNVVLIGQLLANKGRHWPRLLRLGAVLATQAVAVAGLATGGFGLLPDDVAAGLRDTVLATLTWRAVLAPPEIIVALPQIGALAMVLALVAAVRWAVLDPRPAGAVLPFLVLALATATALAADVVVAGVFHAAAGAMLLGAAALELHRHVKLDPLTELPVRRALTTLLERQRQPYALALVDVDHLAQLNDRYGHEVGNQILRMVAFQLTRLPHPVAVFRYGGDSFAVVFKAITARKALEAMQSLRWDVERRGFRLRRRGRPPRLSARLARRHRGALPYTVPALTVTVTIGITDADPGQDQTRRVIQAADMAYHQAKRQGRNRIVVA